MSYARRFTEATGTPPGEWLIAERVEEAKRLLVERRRGIDEIATAVGMGSVDTLRHHSRRRAGISPQSYWDQFGAP